MKPAAGAYERGWGGEDVLIGDRRRPRTYMKITGHFCSVTYPEAAELDIDNLEHGFFVNTQLDPDKCSRDAGSPTLAKMTPDSSEAGALIKLLVAHHVAITSTLLVFEKTAGLGKPVFKLGIVLIVGGGALESG